MSNLKSSINLCKDHIVITNHDAVVLYANNAVLKTTGYLSSEIIEVKAGKLWGGLMELEFYEKMWNKIALKKETFYGVMKNQKKNGEIYYAFVKIIPVIDSQDEVKYYIGIERDVTNIIEDFGGIPPSEYDDLKRLVGEDLHKAGEIDWKMIEEMLLEIKAS